MLDTVLKHFQERGIKAEMHPKTDEIPFPQIWMTLGQFILQIGNTPLKIPVEKAPVSGSEIHFLNFFTIFPYKLERDSLSDGARLASLINKTAPLSGFSLSEVDQSIVFQYTYPTAQFSPAELDSLIHLIGHSMELYAPFIKDLAEKKLSYEQLLNQ